MLIRATVWLVVFLLAMGQPATLLASDYFGQVTFNGLPVPGATVTATQADRRHRPRPMPTVSTTSPILRTGSGR